jgi:hypothetical protein
VYLIHYINIDYTWLFIRQTFKRNLSKEKLVFLRKQKKKIIQVTKAVVKNLIVFSFYPYENIITMTDPHIACHFYTERIKKA